MVDAGLRSGEVCNLKINDIDFEKRYIFIRSGKGRKDRYVSLADNLSEILLSYLRRRKQFLDVHGRRSEQLLIAREGEYNKNCTKNIFSRIRKKLNFEKFYPHLLRHTFATSFIMGGGDVSLLQLYMGHESLSITENYLHLAQTYRLIDFDIYKLDKSIFKTFY